MYPETLRNWVRRPEVDEGRRPGTTSADSQRIAELEREIRELKRRMTFCGPRVLFFRGSGARPQTEVIVAYIDEHRERVVEGRRLGVEPICDVLATADVQVAPSTYYASKTRPPSARAVRDGELVAVIHQAHEANFGVYGARKIHAELNRNGHGVARCTVERLMKAQGLRGTARDRPARPRPATTGLRANGLQTSLSGSSSRARRTSFGWRT